MRMYYAVGKFSPFQTKSIPLCSSPSGTELVLYRHSLRSISHNKIQSSILISIYSKTLVFNKIDSLFYLHQHHGFCSFLVHLPLVGFILLTLKLFNSFFNLDNSIFRFNDIVLNKLHIWVKGPSLQ